MLFIKPTMFISQAFLLLVFCATTLAAPTFIPTAAPTNAFKVVDDAKTNPLALNAPAQTNSLVPIGCDMIDAGANSSAEALAMQAANSAQALKYLLYAIHLETDID